MLGVCKKYLNYLSRQKFTITEKLIFLQNNHLSIQQNYSIGLVGRVFANGPGNLSSIPSRVIPKILKMVLDTSLLNTRQYKLRIEDKAEHSREKSSALPNTSV